MLRPGCVLMFAALLSGGTGCQLTSRWAMDYPEYADKYDAPYPDDDVGKWQRMAKQMVDARHVAEESGWYTNLAGGVHDGDAAFLGEIGLLTFPTSWLEARAGLLGGVASPPGILFGGIGGGLRVQTPTRAAPFVGAGLFVGGNDSGDEDSLFADEEESQAFGAIYPEVGMHFWLNGCTRLSVSASHWFSSEGREHDLWVFGVSLSGI